jgi:hypothetical protein
VAIVNTNNFELEKILKKLFFSKYSASGNTVIVAKKNREKLKVNGPIEPIPVVCETKAVPHIKVAISIKKFARV